MQIYLKTILHQVYIQCSGCFLQARMNEFSYIFNRAVVTHRIGFY